MVTTKTERILISISVSQVRDFIQPKHTVWLIKFGIQVDRNLMLYLPRLTVLVSIEADRPRAWFPGPLGPYQAWFSAI
jgi:hypothetical protein